MTAGSNPRNRLTGKILALSEDGDPAQAGPEAFQQKHFEELLIVVKRHTPFWS